MNQTFSKTAHRDATRATNALKPRAFVVKLFSDRFTKFRRKRMSGDSVSATRLMHGGAHGECDSRGDARATTRWERTACKAGVYI